MIRGLYAAASGLQVASEQQDVTAHNLAHATTPGYRQRGLVFESFDLYLNRAVAPSGDPVGALTIQTFHDFRPGPLRETGKPEDLALAEPDRFFVLDGPNGPLYTRNGTFFRNARGEFVSQAGYPLQGDTGVVRVPPDTLQFNIAQDGTVTADREEVGRVRTVRFADPKQLTAAGPTLFTAPPEAGLENAPARVLQGYREGSNVEPADAMVRMLLGARYYEAAQRSLRTIAESVQLNTRPTGT